MKPSNPKEQSVTWSNYKNKNTLKVMIGISPRGMVTYVSDTYGGSATERQIIERSELLHDDQKFSEGDSIMADRGFIVQDLFCLKKVAVNTPTVMRNMNQLPSETVIRDQRIASKRVHVERIIGMAKRFKILTSPMHSSLIPVAGRIVFVCFSICNFKRCQIGN